MNLEQNTKQNVMYDNVYWKKEKSKKSRKKVKKI